MVIWVVLPLDINQAAIQFWEELKTTLLIVQISSKPKMQLQKQFKAYLPLLSVPKLHLFISKGL